MIKFFRKIRQNLIKENKVTKYVLYAIGEIFLVVIGILIALQINNVNEANKTRERELSYLRGIKADLSLNLLELQKTVKAREAHIESSNIIIDYYENQLVEDLDHFNLHVINVCLWFPSDFNNNTFQELLNSGNLAIISNDSIKNDLLNMDIGYKKIRYLENHIQHDLDILIYDQYYTFADVNSSIKNYFQQVGNSPENRVDIGKERVQLLLESQKFKNGCALIIFNNNSLIEKYNNMISTTNKLITRIDNEMETK
ncbi:DUF6090 family protein [Seonamhaeicola maritimus]|uniref:Uncharacterized protein n=1 Tax=Seonamhaeicola maritimus TaxID=2591822 RepID=A0A5C7GM39_9FLAO|nr:DUF6090 family protein [Seonamhaeicola maritimus]TXG38981.1 hypothetical protein FUA22_03590 [Seonamhaeicola maritimus]